jgi:hypothetical protein
LIFQNKQLAHSCENLKKELEGVLKSQAQLEKNNSSLGSVVEKVIEVLSKVRVGFMFRLQFFRMKLLSILTFYDFLTTRNPHPSAVELIKVMRPVDSLKNSKKEHLWKTVQVKRLPS